MKLVSFIVAWLPVCCLAARLHAREVITCKSPDGKFALSHVYNDQQPYTGDTAIIEVATRKTCAGTSAQMNKRRIETIKGGFIR